MAPLILWLGLWLLQNINNTITNLFSEQRTVRDPATNYIVTPYQIYTYVILLTPEDQVTPLKLGVQWLQTPS
jgi:hypothetical protein